MSLKYRDSTVYIHVQPYILYTALPHHIDGTNAHNTAHAQFTCAAMC